MASPRLSEHLRCAPGIAAALGAGARVAVVGSSGWLGGAALAMLDRALPDAELARSLMVFGSRARPISLPSGREVACHALDSLADADLSGAAILHFAYLTRERAGAVEADRFVAVNEAIQAAVVGAARRAKGLFFASSGAVYQVPEGERPTAERDLYGWQKRRHETEFAALAGDTAVVTGRIFSVGGEYINKPEAYALSSMLVALREGGPVRLRSARAVWRSYAYVGDIVNLALSLLLAGRSEAAFDIAGAEPIEIGRLAALCAELTGRADATIERPAPDGAAPDRMLGDPARYHALLAEMGLSALPLADQVRATAGYLDAVRGG